MQNEPLIVAYYVRTTYWSPLSSYWSTSSTRIVHVVWYWTATSMYVYTAHVPVQTGIWVYQAVSGLFEQGRWKIKISTLSETLGKDRSDNLRECSSVHVVLAVARNRFCGPVLRVNVSLRSLIFVCVNGISWPWRDPLILTLTWLSDFDHGRWLWPKRERWW